MLALYRFASRWPLGLLHALGAALGWLTWLASPIYRRRIRENARLAGYGFAQVRPSVAHAGRMALETPRLWFGAPVAVSWQGADLLDQAYAARKGIVFMTPHMGCFEITAQVVGARYHAEHGPITVLYRPSRQAALAEVIETARRREGLETAPTTLAGVRQMIRALRAGRAVGLLPDQVPPEGMGLWLPFFGKPAYTMTLAARLIGQTGATPLLVWGERLPRAQGFCIHIQAFPEPLSSDLETGVAQINRAMEGLIRQCPQQYLWGYGRYKTPRSLGA
ncbi:lysophospholipid acyltransferase family protein [Ottowia sp.]|uniref:lysophospholipid acyltransferase family protein n=1 Tax=Ottowia sp. TaxID=1898956 RepID=UPI002CE17897|nr:lysophospholipid acyltransferase family protein [Ottowia sp.]HRN74563.1 lysophospholipid acyltransferase family protein [Ottowia sp.]HRQ01981.1 lysophospholipid acyltransferase family protein [Ottowia sp.]